MATVAMLFALLETGWRVYLSNFTTDVKPVKYARLQNVPVHLMRYEPPPYPSYALNPDFVRDGGRNRHDELGFRGPDLRRKQAELVAPLVR